MKVYVTRQLQGSALEKLRAEGYEVEVYEGEPDLNPELFALDNVLMLPHIGSATQDTCEAMAHLAADNIIAVLKDEQPLTPVNT